MPGGKSSSAPPPEFSPHFIAFMISGLTTLSNVSALKGPTTLYAITPSPRTIKVSGTP